VLATNPSLKKNPTLEPTLAIISDIHANITALEAVLRDIEARGIIEIICLGDLVGKGPNPRACVDRIRELGCPVIQGNWDELVTRDLDKVFDSMLEAILWQREQLGDERLEYLRGLPFSLDLERRPGLVRLLHASPQDVWHRVGIRAILSGETHKLAAMFDATENTGSETRIPVAIGFGDIHTAYVLNLPGYVPELERVKGRTLFNVGSVGNPMDMPIPVYGILGGGPGLEVSLIRVPYDNELECQRAVESGMPHLEEYLEETRFARYRPRG
jgi:protein phosphatase